MTKIDQAIEYVKMELGFVKDPIGYQEAEYYVSCRAKEDILEDVLYRLEQIKKGK